MSYSSSRNLEVDTMSYKTKKRWLLLKVQNLKKYYNEILTAFKERLDNVVNPVLNRANLLLAETNEGNFLEDFSNVGNGIETCSNKLFDIELFCCQDEGFCSDEESEFPQKFKSGSFSKILTSSAARLEISPQIAESHCSGHSNDNDRRVEHRLCRDEYTKDLSSLHRFPTPSSSVIHASPRSRDSETQSNSDVDILLLHDIKAGSETKVLVCDVISPSLFSVQPQHCWEQLVRLQQKLNKLYAETWTDQLKFPGNPNLGTICVALYDIDKCWYRAKILKKLPDEKYEAVYIDYGNHNLVKKEDLRIIDPELGNVPQFSIQCSLCGVIPTPSVLKAENLLFSPTEGALKWSATAQEWFHQQVFGNQFIARFTPNTNCRDPQYYCELCTIDQSSNGELAILNIAEGLVRMGYASFSSPDNRLDSDKSNEKFIKSFRPVLSPSARVNSTKDSVHPKPKFGDAVDSFPSRSESTRCHSRPQNSLSFALHGNLRRRNFQHSTPSRDFTPSSLPICTPQNHSGYRNRSLSKNRHCNSF